MRTPKFSVVVASFSGLAPLERCLAALEGQVDEYIVAAPAGSLDAEAVQANPSRRLVLAEPGADVFRLRSFGLAHATGDRVALIEGHCVVAHCWRASREQAHAKGHAIVGGPVRNGRTATAFDWGLYFAEYGMFLPRGEDGVVSAVAGLNVSYEWSLLDSCRDVWSGGFRENEVHDALGARGHSLHWVDSAIVDSHLDFDPRFAARHLFAGGRHFAGYRAARESQTMAALRLLLSPLVPPLLLARLIFAIVRRDRRRLATFLRALPWLAALLASWAAGEAAGALGFLWGGSRTCTSESTPAAGRIDAASAVTRAS